MTLAEKLCLSAAFLFLMTGLFTGIWKYRHMSRSADATAPVYVDIAHRSSLMYAFAALVLGQLAAYSQFPPLVNTVAALVALSYFAFAILSYILHGLLQDTDNQLRRPHQLGRMQLPGWMMSLFMTTLILAEVGGTLTLGVGAMLRIWGGA